MQPRLMSDGGRVTPLSVRYVDGSAAAVYSYAKRDIGIDALFQETKQEIVDRVKLGDMTFVALIPCDHKLDTPYLENPDTRLYFVPEHPNVALGSMGQLTTYYALALFADGACHELEVVNVRSRLVDWDTGVAHMEKLSGKVDARIQKIIDRILEVDKWVKADKENITMEERRRRVGVASGARILVSSSSLGEYAYG